MSADFSRAAAVLGQGLVEHADADELRGVKRAVFMDRGGHAPGETCPTSLWPVGGQHHYECRWPDDECTCHLLGGGR